MPWLLLIIKAYIVYIEFCIRHSEGPISRPVTFGGQCGGPRLVFRASSGLENCTRPLVFTSGSSVRASGNCHLLARQDE